jgi:hypothetical protein
MWIWCNWLGDSVIGFCNCANECVSLIKVCYFFWSTKYLSSFQPSPCTMELLFSVLWDNPLSTWNLFQRFYRYHEFLYEKEQQTKRKQSVNAVPYTPYCTILKQCLPQCFNVFFVFFVTLTIFPAVHSGELQALSTFMVNENHFIFCSCSVRYIKWDIWNTGWKIDLYIVLIGRYILKCLLDYQT